jgi:predicted aspartyl protease
LTVLVDTGAVKTGFRRSTLIGLGIDVDAATEFLRVSTASGSLKVHIFNLPQLGVLGVTFTNLTVLCLPMPPTVSADGVLGFDVLSKFRLFVNYRRGIVVAEPFNGIWHGMRFVWQAIWAL